MPLDAAARRRLLARSHPLRPAAVVTPAALTEGVVAHIRACFAKHELVKVRVNADAVAECDAVGEELTRRAPCELVRRVGKVLVLYRAAEHEAD